MREVRGSWPFRTSGNNAGSRRIRKPPIAMLARRAYRRLWPPCLSTHCERDGARGLPSVRLDFCPGAFFSAMLGTSPAENVRDTPAASVHSPSNCFPLNRGFPMRRMVWSLMSVAALALAGCNGSNAPEQGNGGNAATAAKANAVSGTINVRGDNAVSPEAKLVVNLVDVSSTDQAGAAPLASKTIAPVQFPQSFELTFNPADVNPADLYVVKADLTDGERHYKMALQAPVLTKGAPSQVSIELVPEQTPGEKELADFQAVQKQIGGMKISNGTKLEKDVSRA